MKKFNSNGHKIKNILILTSSFNALAQRCLLLLSRRGYQTQYAVVQNGQEMISEVEKLNPTLIIATTLKKAIPEIIWKNILCLIVHPGIKGDRGPSSLDWAIINGAKTWGVTLIEAQKDLDSGPIWGESLFPLRSGVGASKSSLYNQEVSDHAIDLILEAINKIENENEHYQPEQIQIENTLLMAPMQQEQRAIHWENDSNNTIITKINASDGFPGVLSPILNSHFYLYGPHETIGISFQELENKKYYPGEIIAKNREGAICFSTKDSCLWVTHLRQKGDSLKSYLKLPSTVALTQKEIDLSHIPEIDLSFEIKVEKINAEIIFLHFNFYNGAMGTEQCKRLLKTIRQIKEKEDKLKVLILTGGPLYWSNGIHLSLIEIANDPEYESWKNINAIDDVVEEIINTTQFMTIAALQGNGGAGGVPLALATDYVLLREGRVLNPHYSHLGLFGSEYWTYLLPLKLGGDSLAYQLIQKAGPVDDQASKEMGLVDEIICGNNEDFLKKVLDYALQLIGPSHYEKIIQEKIQKKKISLFIHPLKYYRDHELSRMKSDIYNNANGFREKRKEFLFKRLPR